MYNVEKAKVVCTVTEDGLNMQIKQSITEGYIPKSISR